MRTVDVEGVVDAHVPKDLEMDSCCPRRDLLHRCSNVYDDRYLSGIHSLTGW